MHAIPNSSSSAQRRVGKVSKIKPARAGQTKSAFETETNSERAERFYREPGGALMGWMFDEARLRGMSLNEMAAALGVTYGYINQLRNGIRKTKDIAHDFCVACARYLGVPTIAVKVVAGVVRMSDFLHPSETDVNGGVKGSQLAA